MDTIGQFSKISGLSVKTLRFYHEAEVLVPSFVDPDSGGRMPGCWITFARKDWKRCFPAAKSI